MREIETFLSDSDGTFLNTDGLIRQAFIHTFFEHFGIAVADEHIGATLGKPLKECYRLLGIQYKIHISSEDIKVYTTHNDFQNNNLELACPFPGVIELLDKVKSEGIKIAVVTTRTSNGKLMLDRAGISQYLDFLVTGDDVKNHKPDAEALNLALKYLNTHPSKAIMMGDTKVDIEAGKNAETKTIGVTYGSLGKDIAKYNPDFVINHPLEAVEIILGKNSEK